MSKEVIRETNRLVVSVILPVYHTAPYLPQCTDSILSQTFSEFEIICIGNGSTDIPYCYTQQDGRMYVFHKQNQNADIVRNRELEAMGENMSSFLTVALGR